MACTSAIRHGRTRRMSETIHVMDASEAYEAIVERCIADLESAHGDEGRKTTCLCLSCDDGTITDIEVSYDYSLGIDYDCDTNTYAIISASVSISGIEVATYDNNDYEVMTNMTRSLRAINGRRLAYDVAKQLDHNYM